MRGCHGGAAAKWFPDDPELADDTCPRRHVINNPWVHDAHRLYRLTNDGNIGIDGFKSVSGRVVDSIEVVRSAENWRAIQREKNEHGKRN